MGLLLDSTSFWDIMWYMVVFFFWMMAIWVFIALFADIFHRKDLNGWGKGGWILLIFIIPFLGALIYIIARPKPTEEEIHEMQMRSSGAYPVASGPSTSMNDIAKAHELLLAGALTQAEFDQIKAKAMGTA